MYSIRVLSRTKICSNFIPFFYFLEGVAVARRLSDNPKQRVLLLEAGPDEPTVVTVPVFAFRANNTQYDWQYKTTPQKRACLSTNGECIWPRGKMLCGTACLSGISSRLNYFDFIYLVIK